MNYDKICPNCVTELKKESKKLGRFSAWLICPECGYRTRESSLIRDNAEKLNELQERIIESNNSQSPLN